MSEVADRYRELVARVDAFFDRVRARHATAMVCGPGCDSCCHVRPTVSPVEADAVRAFVASLSEVERKAVIERARTAAEDRCAALGPDGQCAIYAARPLVCRSHGLPIRIRDARSLPVVSSCGKNFVARGAAAVDADCILDQETLSTIVHALDVAHARARGGTPGEREDLSVVLGR